MRNILFIIMTIGLFGCASPKQEDFVGVWVGDSLILELRGDGSCIATGNNAYLLLEDGAQPSDTNQVITGYWEFKYLFRQHSIFDSKNIEVSFTNNDTTWSRCCIIHYTRSLTTKSYMLYFDLSDPDEMNRFEFKKQND